MLPPQQMLPPHMLQAYCMMAPMSHMYPLHIPPLVPYMQPPMQLYLPPPNAEPTRAVAATSSAASAEVGAYLALPQMLLNSSSSSSLLSAHEMRAATNVCEGGSDDQVAGVLAQHRPWAMDSCLGSSAAATTGQSIAGRPANDTGATLSPESIIASAVKEANVSLRRIQADVVPTVMKRQRDIPTPQLRSAGAECPDQQNGKDIIQFKEACTELLIHAPKKRRNNE